MMALSSLFILMTQHGLEYPNFYEKLYALLVPSIFMAKHRAKFFQVMLTVQSTNHMVMKIQLYWLSVYHFINGRPHKPQLLDSCLKSPLLPAYLAAAFAKKLSRLSISVPPSGSLVIVVLIHNLLRRHPSINCLVHRVSTKSYSKQIFVVCIILDVFYLLIERFQILLARHFNYLNIRIFYMRIEQTIFLFFY